MSYEALSDKAVVMIVGPAAIGKSSIMNQVVKIDADFRRVSGFTTRPPRSNDEPGLYRYLSQDQAAEIIAEGVVQYAKHPTTGIIYGTQIKDYHGKYNLIDTLYSAVDNYRQLAFRRSFTISLTTTPDLWRKWFLDRYPKPNVDAKKRLEEARQSLAWSLTQPDTPEHLWLVNDRSVNQTAQKLIRLVKNTSPPEDGPTHARAILELIEREDVWPSPK